MTTNNRLELRWTGKDSRSRIEPRILIPEDANSFHAPTRSNSDEFDNRLIYGDNLLALKAIEQEFVGKVKCVFIDPPYNTGSAFEHYDDGIEHSLWLNMIWQRLVVLRNLLSDDGSIWISIDDTEAHYLKVICDEIFGRANFVANVVWQKKYTVANDAKLFSPNHDHILVYAKDKTRWSINKLPRSEEMNARYSNPDGHPKGVWKATPLHAKSGSEKGRLFKFRFRNGREWSPPPGTFPRFSEETLRRLDEGNEIWFGKDGKAQPSRKTFLSELSGDGTPPLTVWLHDEVGNNHEAKNEVKAFNAEEVFDTPKPERLLHRIIHLATNVGDLVLDSFAGSGTTGAVAHKMGRRWIMIELGEHAKSHVIPRLRKVIGGEDPGGVTEVVGWGGGGGFRFYRLAPSLLEKDKWGNWIVSRKYNSAMLAEALCKLMGFMYAPSQDMAEYWRHGHSSERDFIFVTTASLTHEQLKAISLDVGPDRTLLVCCKAFNARPEDFENLTVKKIPHAVLSRCEWGRDDYSLEVSSLPIVERAIDTPRHIATNEGAKEKRKANDDQPTLFGVGEE